MTFCCARRLAVGFAWLLLLAVSPCSAAVSLAGIFGDHMVLQRDQPIRIWGGASPGEQVSVQFRQQRAAAVADPSGRWSVQLKPEPAGGPHELVVSGGNTIRVGDVLVGEVWLCAGQSNMEWALADSTDGAAEVAAANDTQIRHIKVPHATALGPRDDIPQSSWQVSSPASAGKFSAVAYHFAKSLRRNQDVPVGLVNVSWGGSHIETWMGREALSAHPQLRKLVPRLPATNEAFAELQRTAMNAIVSSWQGAVESAGAATNWADPGYRDAHWQTLQAPRIWEEQGLDGFDGVLWYRRRISVPEDASINEAVLQLGAIDDCDETFLNGVRLGGRCGWDTPRRYTVPVGLLKAGDNLIAVRVTDNGGGGGFHGEPSAMKLVAGAWQLPLSGAWKARVEAPRLRAAPSVNDLASLAYNAMLHPLVGLPMRGMLWYQGESNVPRAAEYATSFPVFISDLRRRWGLGDFPFLYVQLAAYLPLARNSLAVSNWAELRDAQRQALALPNTGMVVATDIGDANDIHPRNKRAVGERLAGLALGVKDAGGPVLRNALPMGGRMELQFDGVAGGLRTIGDELKGFAIADATGIYHAASARITGPDRVQVWHPEIKQPASVRFGWVDNPQESNLFGGNGLPATPFRTDTRPFLTAERHYSF